LLTWEESDPCGMGNPRGLGNVLRNKMGVSQTVILKRGGEGLTREEEMQPLAGKKALHPGGKKR